MSDDPMSNDPEMGQEKTSVKHIKPKKLKHQHTVEASDSHKAKLLRNPQLIQEKSKEQKGFHSAKGPESANSCPEVPITKDFKGKDPIGAFEVMMSYKALFSDKSPSTLTTSEGELARSSKDSLIRELHAKILNVDLFQAIEQYPNIIYEIKALMKKLNTPTSGESIGCFIFEFNPILDTFGRDLQKRKETSSRLGMQTNACSQKCNLVLESKSQMSELD
ncbi:hypothetical protein P8452_37126 [Trifolium repens]|nr:hypothetical protein P8452_37126 [Trifolium repens]